VTLPAFLPPYLLRHQAGQATRRPNPAWKDSDLVIDRGDGLTDEPRHPVLGVVPGSARRRAFPTSGSTISATATPP
jgi:hypothetical protein